MPNEMVRLTDEHLHQLLYEYNAGYFAGQCSGEGADAFAVIWSEAKERGMNMSAYPHVSEALEEVVAEQASTPRAP